MLTTLDAVTALVVVDLQQGHRDVPVVHPLAGVVTNSVSLLDAFRARKLPVALVTVVGTAPGRTERGGRIDTLPPEFGELLSELNHQPADIVVAKRSWGAFASTDLEAQLRARNVTQIVVTGVATGTGVAATAQQAFEAGFNVTIATDAVTDTRQVSHDYAMQHLFPRLGETGTTAEIIALLAKG